MEDVAEDGRVGRGRAGSSWTEVRRNDLQHIRQ